MHKCFLKLYDNRFRQFELVENLNIKLLDTEFYKILTQSDVTSHAELDLFHTIRKLVSASH